MRTFTGAEDLRGLPGEPLLVGLAGSRAFGLATATSDYDYRGVFIAPTAAVLGLNRVSETFERKEPDTVLHEIGKFVGLALAANPHVLEVLFLDDYAVVHPFGRLLVESRDLFLSRLVAITYGGYARSQFQRLVRRGDGSFSADTRKRSEKHARHLLRLLRQGQQLLTEGTLKVRLDDPEEMFAFGRLDQETMAERAEAEFNRLDSLVAASPLPERPDRQAADALLRGIRTQHWDAERQAAA